MVANRRPLSKSRSAIFCAAVAVSLLSTALVAASGDSAPKLLSTTGGNGSVRWSNMAELKKAAAAHDPKACAQYGDALLRGDGVTKDIAQAMMFLREAAAAGEANASFRLGKIYDDGELAPKDYPKAFAYYSDAAKAGVSEAQYNLGVMYAGAHGVKRDYVEGLAWLIVATKNGAPADGEKQVRERLTKTNHQQQIIDAEQRAAEIIKDPAAAVPGSPDPNTLAPTAPQKLQAPAKIELSGSSAPTKINVAPPAAPLPALGPNFGNGLMAPPHVEPPTSPPIEKDGRTPQAQK